MAGDNGYPYCVPINHYYCEQDGKIYFHGGKIGHRVDAVKSCDKVCFTVYDKGFLKEGDWALNVKSVVVFGRMRIVEDFDRAIELCRQLSYKFTSDESYIDKHRASYISNFEQKIEDMYEPYIRPQENSSHCGCTELTVKGEKTDIYITNKSGFSFNASCYTQEELASKRHNFELEKCDNNVICIDFYHSGVGTNSCGPELKEKYRVPLPHASGEITLCFKNKQQS